MFSASKNIPELENVTQEMFRNEIYPAAEPVIMRGLVADWPSVKAAQTSDETLISYMKNLYTGHPVEFLLGPPEIAGHFFYNEDMSGLNFKRSTGTFPDVIDRLFTQTPLASGEAINIQSTPVRALLPGFVEDNRLRVLADNIPPRIWIGNAVRVQTHFDLSQNIACVVGGSREFTLFPPSQTSNLYMGPIERTLAGTPVSLVDIDNIDQGRFPKFNVAAGEAMSAELMPGDAIFIPYFWWHHVRSLDRVNVLINYWWNEFDTLGSPMDAMLHSILTLRDLPPAMKEPWRQIFDEFVFKNDLSASQHIPPKARGGLGSHDWPLRAGLWQALARGVGEFAAQLMRR
ncbi:cupin-like domain-containing protein [Hyphomonas sp.]|jgi:hypothetical protein|uniref:cupin-like domain-containing protein n=1 Tax=Hyphomonas sp. TaxID=87 RepID=UPI0039E6BD00